jgi:hypothetical protein
VAAPNRTRYESSQLTSNSTGPPNFLCGGFFRPRLFTEFLAPMGVSSDCEETKNATAVVLTPPPMGILFFAEKPGIVALTTLQLTGPRRRRSTLTAMASVSVESPLPRSSPAPPARAAADSTALPSSGIDRLLLSRWLHSSGATSDLTQFPSRLQPYARNQPRSDSLSVPSVASQLFPKGSVLPD